MKIDKKLKITKAVFQNVLPILKIYYLHNRFSAVNEFWNNGQNIIKEIYKYVKFIILDFDEFIKSVVIGWLNCIEYSTKIRIYLRDGSSERIILRQHDSR